MDVGRREDCPAEGGGIAKDFTASGMRLAALDLALWRCRGVSDDDGEMDRESEREQQQGNGGETRRHRQNARAGLPSFDQSVLQRRGDQQADDECQIANDPACNPFDRATARRIRAEMCR